jgi:hypothetical protein
MPPVDVPQFFASDANFTWQTGPSEDPNQAGKDKAGKVDAIVEVGDKVFVGGEFATVMPPKVKTADARLDATPLVRQPFLVAFDVRTGALLDWDAHPDGDVLALAASPDGKRLYVGGRFRTIGGGRSDRLAALDVATGRLDTTFQPPVPSAFVRAFSLSGDTLYIGGAFTRMGTVDRAQVAALDATSGALRTGWTPPPNTGGYFQGHTGKPADDNVGSVTDIKITADRSMVVIGGSFSGFAGQAGLLVLDAATGVATAWQPTLDTPRPVFGLDIWSGDGKTIFAAAGGRGGAVEAFRPGAATKPLWVHKVDGDGQDVVSTRSRLYFVGHYDYVLGNNTVCGTTSCTGGNPGDVVNHHISAFDPVNGAHDLSFAAQFNTAQGPDVAFIGADHLYIGGDFTRTNWRPQAGFAQFPAVAVP